MRSKLTKYKIGLAVIGLFTIVLLIIVLMEAGPTKQDSNTYNQANNIANKLNTYVDSSGLVPDTLATAGAYNAPSTISYTELSDTSYRFCVDYKTTSDNFDPSAAETSLITSSGHGSSKDQSLDQSYAADGFLFIDPDHHKGNNCQTVSIISIFGTSPNINLQTE